jgi:hypothetical protein
MDSGHERRILNPVARFCGVGACPVSIRVLHAWDPWTLVVQLGEKLSEKSRLTQIRVTGHSHPIDEYSPKGPDRKGQTI